MPTSGEEKIQLTAAELVLLWFDGFGSGVATMYLKAGKTEAEADQAAQDMVDRITSDDVAMQQIIADVIDGICNSDRPNQTVAVSHIVRSFN